MSSTCPRCQSVRVVAGKHFNWMGGSIFQYFQPKELRFLCNSSHTPISKQGFLACTDCGLLWSEVDAKALQKLLTESGNKSVKARLGM